MEQKSNRSIHRFIKSCVISVSIILLASAISNQAQAAPAAAGFDLFYDLTVRPDELRLCPGETKTIHVWLWRTIFASDPNVDFQFSEIVGAGARIQSGEWDQSVGDFVRFSVTTTRTNLQQYLRNGVMNAYATFQYIGIKPGNDTIRFFVISTGEEDSFGPLPNDDIPEIFLDVEVTPCYEAYASGLTSGNLVNEWSDKDICGIDQPFILAARGKAQGGGATMDIASNIMAFLPLSDSKGIYFTQEKAVIQGVGLRGVCDNFAVGDYEVKWNSQDIDGNLILKGTITFCGQQPVSVPDIWIAFRSLKPDTAGNVSCQRP